MSKRRTNYILALAGLLPFALAACSDATSSIDPRTRIPLVRVAPVTTAVQAARSFTGVVAARVQSDLGFRVPGKVLARLVDTGPKVCEIRGITCRIGKILSALTALKAT